MRLMSNFVQLRYAWRLNRCIYFASVFCFSRFIESLLITSSNIFRNRSRSVSMAWEYDSYWGKGKEEGEGGARISRCHYGLRQSISRSSEMAFRRFNHMDPKYLRYYILLDFFWCPFKRDSIQGPSTLAILLRSSPDRCERLNSHEC
jgi:hypothetical protein